MNPKHLLIDSKNMLYRAAYAAQSDKKFKDSGHHPINIVLHLLSHYQNKFKAKQVHIFWDSGRDSTWRRKLEPEYKNNRSNIDKDGFDIKTAIGDLTEVCLLLFQNMGIRQYFRNTMEADDLIYAFCKMNRDDSTVIISSDGDLLQIPYNFKNVSVHNPQRSRLLEATPDIDPVIYKCLAGDKSDNIDGYYGVGKVRAKVLSSDSAMRRAFFDSDKAIIKEGDERPIVGDQQFERNLRLIDLSLCPQLLENMMYVSRKQYQPIRFDLKSVRELIGKYKLRGVTADISRYIVPFKKLTEVQDGSRNSPREHQTSSH